MAPVARHVRTWFAGSALLLVACGAPPPPSHPAAATAASVTIPGVPAERTCDRSTPGAAPSSSPRPSLCWARGRPAAAATPSSDEYCSPIDATELTRVEARVRKELKGGGTSTRLVVDFGCDHTIGAIDEVLFEEGSGHGGSLHIVRFHREGASASVREIAYSHYYNKGLTIRSGDVPLAAFDGALGGSRVALLAKPHVIPLTLHDGSIMLGLAGYWSSNDFHLRLGFVDDDGRVTERHFTGYDSSAEQTEIVPMRMATEPWAKLLAAANLTAVTADDDDRRFFVSRLRSTFADHPGWWVAERYVAIVATLGTIDAVPTLVSLLGKKEKENASDERMRDAALEAIATITGWDPRVDSETHQARTTEDAAAAAIAECSR